MLSLLASPQLHANRTSALRPLVEVLVSAACASSGPQAGTGPLLHPCRSLCAAATTGAPRFAFDIDGVLKRGNEVLPAALEAMQMLHDRTTREPSAPLVFMTNGGGVSESMRAAQLSDMLGVRVRAEQVILSHTPMQGLVPAYRDEAVLVSGRKQCLEVARAYGFARAVSPTQLAAAHGPGAAPFSSVPSPADLHHATGVPCPVATWGAGTERAPIRAVLLFTDPSDWYQDLQLIADAVLSHGVVGAPHALPGAAPAACSALQSASKEHPWPAPERLQPLVPIARRSEAHAAHPVRIVAAHNDLLWPTAFPTPRFGLGAFVAALQTLLHACAGERAPSVEFFGKPTAAPYQLAEARLRQQATALGLAEDGPVYMVGDNPKSDIAGANALGGPWRSVLVRSGVFQGVNDSEFPAHVVVDTVADAVAAATHEARRRRWHAQR